MSAARLPHDTGDQHAVIDLVRASRIFTAFSALTAALGRSMETSSGIAALQKVRAAVAAAPWRTRAQALAVMLATASIVHLVLNAAFGDPAGRFWLALPLVALATAIVLLIAASPSRPPGRAL